MEPTRPGDSGAFLSARRMFDQPNPPLRDREVDRRDFDILVIRKSIVVNRDRFVIGSTASRRGPDGRRCSRGRSVTAEGLTTPASVLQGVRHAYPQGCEQGCGHVEGAGASRGAGTGFPR